MNKPDLGFIGLGIMGEPMAGHLANAGYRVAVYDLDRNSCEKTAQKHSGITIKDSPRAVGEAAEIVITMLPSGRFVQEVALGDNGLIHGLRSGAVLLDTSSCEPWLTQETAAALAGKGISMVDAPVSGAQIGAIQAQLVFMVGSDAKSLQRVTPLLEIMGKQIFHLGPVGAGHAMKCINNLITAVTLLATAEGLTIGKKFGLDPEVMVDVLNVSTGGSWVARTHIKQRITNRKFDDPFKLGLMVKDIEIAMKLARDLDLPLKLTSLNETLWTEAREHEGAEMSVSNLVRWLEQTTGVEISAGNQGSANS
ncbi:MAG TPA: NAD(P)-dependent oxidoreductase [Xanthomonadales bacterium]|nr:NAD(P)-dependent oxidoreductase [Xanthomonadales bacterium]